MTKIIINRLTPLLVAGMFCAVDLPNPASGQGCSLAFPVNNSLNAFVTIYPNWVVPPGDPDPNHGFTTPPATYAVAVSAANAPIPAGVYPAWSVDALTSINPAQYVIPGTAYAGTLISTSDSNGLAFLPNHGGLPPVGPPSVVPLATWHQVNYILNHKTTNDYWWNVQVAINRLVGGPAPNDPLLSNPAPGYPPVDTNQVNALLADAASNAASWTLPCGGIVGVIYVIRPTADNPVQFLMLEVPCLCPQPAADCVAIDAVQGVAITPATLVGTGGCGGPYTFSATGLPAGLTLSPAGVISGTPTVNGTFNYVVTLLDNCGNPGTLNCSVSVQPNCIPGIIGGVDLRGIVDSCLFFFANGTTDANWQGATKGFVGNVVVNGGASFRSSGGVPYAGTIYTDGSSIGQWQTKIVNPQSKLASANFSNTALLAGMKAKLNAAFAQINALPVSPNFAGHSFNRVSAASLNGLNTTTADGVAHTYVINITSGFQVSSQINITGNPGDVFILRWDTDANPANGYQGQVKFQSGGGIVPHGGLTPGSFLNVAGDINSSGGGGNPPAPYPQGPRYNNGAGALVPGGANFSGGGFFTGYWLTTGDPKTGQTASLSNGIFVGGWFTTTTKFSMTSGTSGVYVAPTCP